MQLIDTFCFMMCMWSYLYELKMNKGLKKNHEHGAHANFYISLGGVQETITLPPSHEVSWMTKPSNPMDNLTGSQCNRQTRAHTQTHTTEHCTVTHTHTETQDKVDQGV